MAKYILMHKNYHILEFDTTRKSMSVISKKDIPIPVRNMPRDYLMVNSFFAQRCMQTNRKHYNQILEICGMDNSTEISLGISGKGLSYTDHYWIKEVDSHDRWEDVNLFKNIFSADVAYTALTGEKSKGKCMKPVVSGELRGKGVKAKCFIKERNAIALHYSQESGHVF